MRLKLFIIILMFVGLTTVKAQRMVVSSYYIGADQRDSWIELLVTDDDVDVRNWTLGDYEPNGGGHLQNYRSIMFRNIPYWNHLRRGTIIVVYCRQANSANVRYTRDTSTADGYIQITAQDASLFSNIPALTDLKLNFHIGNEKVHLIDRFGGDVHSLGHGTNHSNFLMVNAPKLVNDGAGVLKRQIQVCPGATLAEYNNIIEDTIKTNMVELDFTSGLPNRRAGNLTANTGFWQTQREPLWNLPTLSITTSLSRTTDTLEWNLSTDTYPADSLQGYLILMSTTGTFLAGPEDGVTYAVGNFIGGARVIGQIHSSGSNRFVYEHVAECGPTYYRVYAYRYKTDEPNGNNYHVARGRAYNQISFASGNSDRVNPIPILFHY